MSLHVQLSPEALARLKAQQRNSTITSIIISILVVLLICITLLFLLLPAVKSHTPEIVSYSAFTEEEESTPTQEITRSIQRPPSTTSPNASKVIAANTVSNVAIPTTQDYVEATQDFGSSDDSFDEGWGDIGGDNSEELSTFGVANKISGTIEGYLYDFKQTPKGKPLLDYNIERKSSDFADRVQRLHNRRYNEASLARHYRAQKPLYLRMVSIPLTGAEDGPKFFGAEKEIEPSGWIAHYKGKIVAPKNGTFRFAGSADDYLSVILDDEFKLMEAWSRLADHVAVKGANAEEGDFPEGDQGPFSSRHPLTYGSWFTVRKGQELDIAITIGERPGGDAAFLLLIEEQGVEYRKAGNQTILPPFTMGELSTGDIKKLKSFPKWEIETENVPVFKAR